MSVIRGLDLIGAINPLVRATSAPATSINPLAIAPPPTKDDLLGPGNTAPLPPAPAPVVSTSIVKTAITTATKPPPGAFSFGPSGSGPSPSPSPSPAPAPVPSGGGTGAGYDGGYDVERPERPDPEPFDGPSPSPSPFGGGGRGFQNASNVMPSESSGVPTWAIALGAVALAGGGLLAWRFLR